MRAQAHSLPMLGLSSATKRTAYSLTLTANRVVHLCINILASLPQL
jgi:hypothetical protein